MFSILYLDAAIASSLNINGDNIMNYVKECLFIIEQMKKAYEKFASRALTISTKDSFDLVTTLDKNIEEYLTQQIAAQYPCDLVNGEEYTSNNTEFKNQRIWTIDPIDGTSNMANNINIYGVQCALVVDGKIVLGAIYFPQTDEVIWAIDGCGSYCNTQRIGVNFSISRDQALVNFGDYPHSNENIARNTQHDVVGKVYPQVSKIRMFGAACFDLSSVARGKAHASVCCTTNAWDVAPGVIICKEAGAVVTNCLGEEYHVGDEGVVVSATEELSKLITDAFKECIQN
jgi:myo-inositol-1(or 4)-monophosphatase